MAPGNLTRIHSLLVQPCRSHSYSIKTIMLTAAFSMRPLGIKYKSTMPFDQLTTFSERQPDAPILAFTFDIVASANFNTARLKQGSGTVTYKSKTNSFEPVNQFPGQLTLQGTGENGNTEYGEVDSAAARSITLGGKKLKTVESGGRYTTMQWRLNPIMVHLHQPSPLLVCRDLVPYRASDHHLAAKMRTNHCLRSRT
jgi:hypothetical protein